MKLLLGIFFSFSLVFIFSSGVYAKSSYVLPYPSAMPGNFFYKINLIKDELGSFWSFGDFSKFSYNLKQSDKYLVEAKTLFDYKQYLLGYNALINSDKYFQKIEPMLTNAKKSGKNITQKKDIMDEASLKHIEELEKLKNNVPATFEWTPEKGSPTTLPLHEAIDNSIKLRRK